MVGSPGVPFCNQKIHQKVHKAENGQEPVEVIQVTFVEIICYPSKLPISCCDVSDNGHQKCAEVAFVIIKIESCYHLKPDDLQNARSHHGKDGNDEANAHARELCEATLVSCDSSSNWDDYAVVDWYPNDNTNGVKDGQGSCRDFEVGTYMGVHGVSLKDKHSAHLTIHS
ncbi:hypothetical protein IEQ34_016995 [Dendrobium chrysotoxum]|uniref:Uncharacterized protein n=1 Tax=Dendrobium chrysotoxum TaxID=161865 RepID=A0AAV7GEZ8_DENCH|nr:hypothetical protein IEQ34_016995 [Dendrobium chrysotoxum]